MSALLRIARLSPCAILIATTLVQGADLPSAELRKLVDQAAGFQRAHYIAEWSNRAMIDGGGESRTEIVYEQWIDGDKFKVSGQIKALRTGKISSYGVAYDGSEYQTILPHDKESAPDMFTYSASMPSDANVLLRPVPMLLPLLFLSRYGDQCPACTIQLTDVRNDVRVEHVLQASRFDRLENGEAVIRSPGSVLLGAPFDYLTYVNRSNHTARLVEAVTVDGRVLIRTAIEYGASSEDRLVPVGARMEWFKPNGEIEAESTLKVRSVALDEELPETTFQLDSSRAAAVWDEDNRYFRRTRTGYVGPGPGGGRPGGSGFVVALVLAFLLAPIVAFGLWRRSSRRMSDPSEK